MNDNKTNKQTNTPNKQEKTWDIRFCVSHPKDDARMEKFLAV